MIYLHLHGFSDAYDPNQKRDEGGRWTKGGGSTKSGTDESGEVWGDYHPEGKFVNSLPEDAKPNRTPGPLPNHDFDGPTFLRFGDIPKGEVSKVGNVPSGMHRMVGIKEGQRLKGVSVFRVKYNKERHLWQVDTNELGDSGRVGLGELIGGQDEYGQGDDGRYFKYKTPPRPMYLVTGKEQEEGGTDGEPLLKNVKILNKLALNEILDHEFDPDEDIYPERNPSLFRK